MNSGVESNSSPSSAIQHTTGNRLKFKKAVVFRFVGVFWRCFFVCKTSELQGGLHSLLSLLSCDAF